MDSQHKLAILDIEHDGAEISNGLLRKLLLIVNVFIIVNQLLEDWLNSIFLLRVGNQRITWTEEG